MTPSLSIILPVRNAQYTIARQVQRLLEIIPDLTSRFEVLIVDDHSTDFTTDLVREIGHEYPQVKLLKQTGKGIASGAKEAAAVATGEIKFAVEQGKLSSPADLRKVWNVRMEARRVLAQTAKPLTISENLMERLGKWGKGTAKAVPQKQDAEQKLPAASRRDDSHTQTPSTHSAPSFVGHLRNLISGEESAVG